MQGDGSGRERGGERVERRWKKREERYLAKAVLTYGTQLYTMEAFALTCNCIFSSVFTTAICMSDLTFSSLASVNKIV